MDKIGLWVIALLARVGIGYFGYSGAGSAPMFGDFEAQRHWLEITTSLPIGDWYRQTKDNNLQYWGLDYPPLTAYVSWIFGMISRCIYPPLVELHASRGHESDYGKMFMRASVILCDFIVFFPAISYCLRQTNIAQRAKKDGKKTLFMLELLCLLSPALLLIDHGHFQYNGVCIGLALLASGFITNEYYVLGSIFFCLSLNFKHMALYYAPVFFFGLLRTCQSNSLATSLTRLFKIGITVIASFAAMWGPFCVFATKPQETCASSMLHVLTRLFPFKRGLFEDKVANLWYCLSVIVDIRALFPVDVLAKLSLLLTLVLIAPTCVNLLMRPVTSHRLTIALVACSLSFFLASFQVHEKSLLLPLVPSMLLLYSEPILVGWFQVLGCFTMFPLLVRDGHRFTYWAAVALFVLLQVFAVRNISVAADHNINNNTSTSSNKPLPPLPETSGSRPSSTTTVPKVPSSSTLSSNHSSPRGSVTHPSPGKKFSHNDLHPREILLVSDEMLSAAASSSNNISTTGDVVYDGSFTILPTNIKWLIVAWSSIGMLALHVMEVLVPPPPRYPDLYPALFSIYGAANLVVLYIVFVAWLWTLPPALPVSATKSRTSPRKEKAN